MDTTENLIRFDTSERTLECDLSPEERRLRSDEAHATTALIISKEADRDKLKAQASAAGKEIDQLTGRHRSLSEAARTGKESRAVLVLREYDKTKGEVVERRDDTGDILVRRKPYASEWTQINAILQAPLDLPDPPKVSWLNLRVWEEKSGVEVLSAVRKLEVLQRYQRGEEIDGYTLYPPTHPDQMTADWPVLIAGEGIRNLPRERIDWTGEIQGGPMTLTPDDDDAADDGGEDKKPTPKKPKSGAQKRAAKKARQGQ